MIDWIRQRLQLPPRTVPVPARELPLDHQQAGDIVSLCGGKPDDHQIMSQNVAHYLAHMRSLGDELPAEALTDKRSLQKAVSAGMSGLGCGREVAEKLRWRSKLQREIQSPYHDRQVGDRVHDCLQDLQSVLPEFAHIPHQLYLVGGPLGEREGRFGANSDLDVVMEVAPDSLLQAQELVGRLERASGERKHTFELHLTSSQQWPTVARYYGASVQLDESRLASQVEGVIRDGLGVHGLQVDGQWQATRTEWSEPVLLSAATPFPRQSVTSLKS